MEKEILIEMPVVNQRRDTKSEKGKINSHWASRTCAICSLKMLLSFKNQEHMGLPVMALVKEALAIDGYIKGIGWKHQALVDLAAKRKIKMGRGFFKEAEKKKGLRILENSLLRGKPAIASVFFKFNPKNGGHMIVVRGIKKQGRDVLGFYIQDPDPSFKGHFYFASREDFLKNWRGGLIYFQTPDPA